MTKRNSKGQFTKGNGIVWLIVIVTVIVGAFFIQNKFSDNTKIETTEAPKKEEITSEQKRLRDYMNSPEFIKEREIKAKTDLLLGDKKFEENKAKAEKIAIEAKAKKDLEAVELRKVEKLNAIEAELEALRKEEMSLASSTKSSLE